MPRTLAATTAHAEANAAAWDEAAARVAEIMQSVSVGLALEIEIFRTFFKAHEGAVQCAAHWRRVAAQPPERMPRHRR